MISCKTIKGFICGALLIIVLELGSIYYFWDDNIAALCFIKHILLGF